jgi:hypothetical protein
MKVIEPQVIDPVLVNGKTVHVRTGTTFLICLPGLGQQRTRNDNWRIGIRALVRAEIGKAKHKNRQ